MGTLWALGVAVDPSVRPLRAHGHTGSRGHTGPAPVGTPVALIGASSLASADCLLKAMFPPHATANARCPGEALGAQPEPHTPPFMPTLDRNHCCR
jgi:hypothetical protein